MTSKADFNAEEWSTVVNGPLYAGMRVLGADRGGTLRETMAMNRVYQDAREGRGDSELLDELVKSPPAIDPDTVRDAGGNLAALVPQQLREAMSILQAKATGAETDAYKRFVMTIAQAVAGAHKEGGFPGRRRHADQRCREPGARRDLVRARGAAGRVTGVRRPSSRAHRSPRCA